MNGQSPSGFTDTPVGTGVGQFATGTKYTQMVVAPTYAVTKPTVTQYLPDRKEIPTKDIAVYSLLDAMIKAKDFDQFFEFIEYNPWILFVWVWF